VVVSADDGTRLHASVQEDPDAPVTVMLCHGYLSNSDSWCYQRAALARSARVVSWDHRGHGRSARGRLSRLTIDQLGRDALAVLQQTTPQGPVVLIGHSMGGMAILALAAQHPDLFGTRVIGTALLATAAGPIRPGLGLPPQAATSLAWVGHRALCLARRLPLPVPAAVGDAAREAARWVIARFAPDLQLPAESSIASMIQATSVEVILALLPEFARLDKTAGLPALARTDTLVLGAADDMVTASSHSTAIAEAVPGARLVMLDGAGHKVHLEQPHRVTPHLQELVARVTAQTTTTIQPHPRHPSAEAS
jgi:pimeloyl-ACP methyl ester carboxylesterase